jgi:hypothetical protein
VYTSESKDVKRLYWLYNIYIYIYQVSDHWHLKIINLRMRSIQRIITLFPGDLDNGTYFLSS